MFGFFVTLKKNELKKIYNNNILSDITICL
jgi:hypothetical protein